MKIKHLLECVNKWSIDRYLREDNLLPVWVGANFRIPRLETYSFSFCANKKKKRKGKWKDFRGEQNSKRTKREGLRFELRACVAQTR